MKIRRSLLQVSVLPLVIVSSLLLLFALSSSPRALDQHQKLVGSTFDLIAKARSSPSFVFFLCNVIIVAILLGGSSRADGELNWVMASSPFSVVQEVVVEEDQVEVTEERVEEDSDYDEEEEDDDDDDDEERVEEDSDYDDEGYDSDNEEEEDDDDDNDEDSIWDTDGDNDFDDEGDEDLNRRIEEFIEKINGIWREEFLREKHLGIFQ